MNPFTRFLSQWSKDHSFAEFIQHWDRLEILVVQVHREKVTVGDAAPEFAQVWPWLQRNYGRWAEKLRPYWQKTRAAGAPTQTDPFQLLLEIDSPNAIVGNWRAMQHLPAAREALNCFLQDQAAP